jgi:hypothetical protein
MITVLRSRGLQFAIYLVDHPPPHVHVYGDGEAKIILIGRDGRPQLVFARRMKNTELRQALSLAKEHQSELLARWREIHA